jgi:glycosyltransferase involved in cell wall biosynthesis
MYKVSVIIPVYNVEKYIDKCVRSLFSQSLEDVEYIFVDDCTPDRSVEHIQEILREYPQRKSSVKIIKHDVNKGLPAARCTGLNYATGEYIIHSDSDDWMEINMLQELYETAKRENADCVYCDFYFITEEGRTLYKTAQFSSDKSVFLNNWINTNWTVIWNVMVKRELYEKEITYPIEIQFCEDFFLALQLLCYSTKVIKIDKPLHNYNRLNTSSILHVSKKDKMNTDARWANTNIIYFLKKHNYFHLCEKAISWRYLNSVQMDVLDDKCFNIYKTLHPETHKYCLSCPYTNKKIKFLMWCLNNNLDIIAYIIVKLRQFLKR